MTVEWGDVLDEVIVRRKGKVAELERVSSAYLDYNHYWQFKGSKRYAGLLLSWRLNRARRREYLRRCATKEWRELPEARVIK